MVGVMPCVQNNARFTQTQAAKLLEVTARTIRDWENKGIMPAGVRPRRGKSTYYTGSDIKKCWVNYFKI